MARLKRTCLLISLLFLPAFLHAQSVYTLKVNFVIGTVEVMDEVHAPEKGWVPAMYGMELDKDTKVRTGPNSRVEISGSGNKFKISQKTSVRIGSLINTPGSSYTSLQIVTGRVFAVIQSVLKAGDRLEVLTPNAVVGVRGTEFVLGYEKSVSTVQVFKGEVEFADINRARYPVAVAADRMSVLKDPALGPEPVQKIPFSAYREWGVEVPVAEAASKPVTNEGAEVVRAEETVAQDKKLSNAEILEKYRKAQAVSNAARPATAVAVPAMTNSSKTTQARPATNLAKLETEEPAAPTPVAPKSPAKPRFGMNANIGPINIDQHNYQQFVLMPEFGIGPFGVGLYLPAFVDPAKNMLAVSNWYNREDWDFRDWPDGLHDVLMKFLYVKWGAKGSPVFASLGSINEYTLGYGFLMYRFSNMLRFPAERKVGFQFDINTKYGGFETIVQDVFKGEIFGGRVFVHPLFWLDMRLLQKLDVGYSRVVDARPVGGAKWARTVQFWNFDAGIPLVRSDSVEVLLYSCLGGADLDRHATNYPYLGAAFVAGVKGHLSIFKYLLEYRNLDNGLKTEYFNANYDNVRATNYYAINPGFFDKDAFGDQNGILGTAGLAMDKYGSFLLTYWQNLDSPRLDNRLTVLLDVKKGVIPKFYGTVTFEKYNVKTLRDLYKNFLDYRTTITIEGIYSIDPTVDLGVVLKRTYVRDSGGGWTPLTTISFETRFGLFGMQAPPLGLGI